MTEAEINSAALDRTADLAQAILWTIDEFHQKHPTLNEVEVAGVLSLLIIQRGTALFAGLREPTDD